MKKVIVGTILVVGLAAGGAMAQGYRWNSGMGPCNCPQVEDQGPGYGMEQGMKGPGYGKRGKGMKGRGGYSRMADGDNFGPGRFGKTALSPENRATFLDATVELRKELHAKRFELREAKRGKSVDNEKVARIQKDMIDIRTEIKNKRDELTDKETKQQ